MSTDEATTKVKRDAPEGLLTRNPACMMCSEEVSSGDDGWVCEHCSAYWPYEDPDNGSWYDDTAAQCGAIDQPWRGKHFAGKPYQFKTVRCLLEAGHDSEKHRSGGCHEWGGKPDPWAAPKVAS